MFELIIVSIDTKEDIIKGNCVIVTVEITVVNDFLANLDTESENLTDMINTYLDDPDVQAFIRNIAAEYGVKAIVQPGGSVRDEDSIKKSDECGITMLCTGMRHFKH